MSLRTRPICINLKDSIYIISRNRFRFGYGYRNTDYRGRSEDGPSARTFQSLSVLNEKVNILDGTVNETDFFLPFYVPIYHTIATDQNNTMAIIWYGPQCEQEEKFLIFTENNGFKLLDDITPPLNLREQICRLTRIL